MLAWALASCQAMARPNEWFNSDALSNDQRQLLLTDPPRYTQSLIDLDGSRRRLMKVHLDDLQNVISGQHQLGLPRASQAIDLALDILSAMEPPPAILFLTREDKLRQGISLWRARMTGQWEAYHRDEGSEQPALPVPPIELTTEHVADILATCRSLVDDEIGWASVLRQADIPWVHVTYEELARSWDSSIERIWTWLSLPCRRPELPETAKQSDEWSDAIATLLHDSWRLHQDQFEA